MLLRFSSDGVWRTCVMCDIVCYIEIFWGLSHKNGSFSKKMGFFSFSFHHPIFSPSIGWSILIIVFRGWTFYGFWVKIIIVTGLAEIININRLNSPSTAAWSLKVLEKRPKTALNFVFFCVIFGNFSVFGCVTDCVMCDASGRILCARMAVITWHAITVLFPPRSGWFSPKYGRSNFVSWV